MKATFLLVSALLLHIVRAAPPPTWKAERTWVFAVGVIQYDDPGLTSWPDDGRLDQMMIDAFRKRGVPDKQIVFLKNKEGTRDNIMRQLAEFSTRPAADDTLFFYYAGHGMRDYSQPSRPHTFVSYDTGSRWTVASVLDALEKNFRGSRLILTADCCHSGSLAVEAASRAKLPPTAVLTSALATSTSTGNWTFTHCLVDMLEGNPSLDLDHDGSITFRESVTFTDAEMAFSEDQRAGSATQRGFPDSLVMATANGQARGRIGERCEGLEKGKWYKAKIIGEKNGKFLVTWPGWERSYDAWLPGASLRPWTPGRFAPGTKVEIQWHGRWYSGHIVTASQGLHLVHYDGYPDGDDEWVSPARLRPLKRAK